jgi:hypothetical protein
MHSVIATLQFVLENSITFNVSDSTLNKELIDLGLPKGNKGDNIENVESITKTYKSSKDKLIEKSIENVLKSTFFVIKQPTTYSSSSLSMNCWPPPKQVHF